jgi:tRNA threonylcarbamoyladenosine biosynthesis protein TsaE
MEALGGAIACHAPGGFTVFLSGQLAAGKTTLARGLVRALGHAGAVKSPTFTLVESYALADRRVHHFDLYRIADPEELEYLGLDEYFAGGALCIVEWPERGRACLPPADLELSLSVVPEGRLVHAVAKTAEGQELLKEITD